MSMMNSRPLVDIHGSCVSFTVINDKTNEEENRESAVFKNNYFFSHVNHWGLMTKPFPIFPKDEEFRNSDLPPFGVRVISNNFDKRVKELLKESKADWLFLDFYDSARVQVFYPGGWYTHYRDLWDILPKFWEKAETYVTGYGKLHLENDEYLKSCIDKYMEMVIQKYGTDHIILNRVTLSRYVLDRDKELVQFEEEASSIGGWGDNERVREIEDYVLSKYPIASIDISKYFVADWEHEKDYFPVHYENEYYKCADRALKKIVSGETKCVDSLDELAFAYKMDRDVTASSGKDNWRNYILAAENSFSVNPLMDALIANFSFEEMIDYRHIIAYVYRKIYEKIEYFESKKISMLEKQKKLVEYFEEKLKEENEV